MTESTKSTRQNSDLKKKKIDIEFFTRNHTMNIFYYFLFFISIHGSNDRQALASTFHG